MNIHSIVGRKYGARESREVERESVNIAVSCATQDMLSASAGSQLFGVFIAVAHKEKVSVVK